MATDRNAYIKQVVNTMAHAMRSIGLMKSVTSVRTFKLHQNIFHTEHREHTVSAETACVLPPGDATDWQVSA